MQFELVSPERKLASEEVNAVRIPGADGDMTAMADHAPTITSLRPGILTIETSGGEQSFAVTGGFAEIAAGVTVLAERALPVSDVTQDIFSGWVTQARDASGSADDAAAKTLSDLMAMGESIGLSA